MERAVPRKAVRKNIVSHAVKKPSKKVRRRVTVSKKASNAATAAWEKTKNVLPHFFEILNPHASVKAKNQIVNALVRTLKQVIKLLEKIKT
jgi:P2-related tail formation protein